MILAAPKNRYQAFAVHLLISFVLFVFLASIIYFIWYPGFLFWAAGGIDGMKLIAGVDLVIGPFLTLCLYRVGKKGLKFDMAMIAVFQLLCIIYGMWSVWHTKPEAVVYTDGEFWVLSRQSYAQAGVDIDQVPLLRGFRPPWIAVVLPEDADQRFQLRMKWLVKGGVMVATDWYQPLEQNLTLLAEQGKTADNARVKSLLAKTADDAYDATEFADSVRFFPTESNEQFGYLVIDTQTGEVIDFLAK